MAEQMRIDALRNPSGYGILFDQLTQPPGRVGTVPHGFKQVRCPLYPLAFYILGEFSTETLRKEKRHVSTSARSAGVNRKCSASSSSV